MKTLYVVRHAKSSWDDPNLDDFERPLNKRGEADAPKMAKRLKEKEIHPELMLTSPAVRANVTCRKIGAIIQYPDSGIKTEKKLYHADWETILFVVQSLPDKLNSVMLFGHNPGLTDFVNEIGKKIDIDNIPTCGIVSLKFKIQSWKEMSAESGDLLFFDYPKSKND
jgi:phosphohistidine phosphatase